MQKNTTPSIAPLIVKKLLPRQRLNALIAEGLKKGVLTVEAGAGYGKTQCIADFLAEKPDHIIWFQLTQLDNLAVRFWEGFVSAVSSGNESLGQRLQTLDFPGSLDKINKFLHILSEELVSDDFYIFVFDDYHYIEDNRIHWFMENMINCRLKNMSSILISRTPVPLRFTSRIRNRHLQRIETEDLRFTPEETKEYLKMLDLNLSPAQLQELTELTDGWTLSIHLAGWAISNGQTLHREIYESVFPILFNLIDFEIFSHYPYEIQIFLSRLALLDDYDSELIQALSGDDPGMISSLEKTNMFISYNGYTETYHIHNLFVQFLQTRNILSEEEKRETYLFIARWYAEKDQWIDALMASKNALAYDKCWDIMQKIQLKFTDRATAEFLLKQLDQLPRKNNYYERIYLLIKANLLHNNGLFKKADEIATLLIKELEHVENKSPGELELIGESYILKGILSFSLHRLDLAENFRKACSYLPNGSKLFSNTDKMMDSNYAITMRSTDPGELELMQDIFFEAIPYTSALLGNKAYGRAYLCRAEGAYFTGDLSTANEYALQAVYKGRQTKNHPAVCLGYFILIRSAFAEGSSSSVQKYIQLLEQYAEPLKDTREFPLIVDIAEGWMFCKLKLFDQIADWIVDDTINEGVLPPASAGRDLIIRAQYLLYQEKYLELLAFTKNCIPLFEERKIWLALLSARILQSIASYYSGRQDDAMCFLENAYEMAIGNKLHMAFIEYGSHMRTLLKGLREVPSKIIPNDWREYVLKKANTYAKRKLTITSDYYKSINQQYTQEFNLTTKELEILQALCQGLTREEIAAECNISINTVKSKLQIIYGKLGALNLADAVRIAVSSNLVG